MPISPTLCKSSRVIERVTIKEYFLTDLVELMSNDGLPVGWVLAPEEEVTGVDTPEALQAVQKQYMNSSGQWIVMSDE